LRGENLDLYSGLALRVRLLGALFEPSIARSDGKGEAKPRPVVENATRRGILLRTAD